MNDEVCSCKAAWKREWDGEVEMPNGVNEIDMTQFLIIGQWHQEWMNLRAGGASIKKAL